MANVKGNALSAASSISLTDLIIVVNPTTGVAYKGTVSQLISSIGGVPNTTSTELTDSDLDTAYPNAGIDFKVFCENIPIIYIKGPTTWWSLPLGGIAP